MVLVISTVVQCVFSPSYTITHIIENALVFYNETREQKVVQILLVVSTFRRRTTVRNCETFSLFSLMKEEENLPANEPRKQLTIGGKLQHREFPVQGHVI